MKNLIFLFRLILGFFLIAESTQAQNQYELNSGWKCRKASEVSQSGEMLSNPNFDISSWMEAVVPGTVLTTLLKNKKIPDPFYGMNNEEIPDIGTVGPEYYTYWFTKAFQAQRPGKDEEVWLNFRGVNYSCDVFLNGHKLNQERHYGMMLRQHYRISQFLNNAGNNQLAVIVFPPDPPGDVSHGGQGGDGTIAKNVTHQYVAGWDWIQPVRDRNTGIWDKVFLEKTGGVNIKNTHIVTRVPGKRYPDQPQGPVKIEVSAELENPAGKTIRGDLRYEIAGKTISKTVDVPAHSTVEISVPSFEFQNPKLWWPNGYGPQNLYSLNLKFVENGNKLSDEEQVRFGIREIQRTWNPFTRSMQISVNGQKIFIKGGNWIISDAMLRFSPQRYDAEIRFHRDMNLNLIRIWGGAIIERPEFYEACDRYGLLVMQDFGYSGDCNGRWLDPKKKDDQWTRRQYPDDHRLAIETTADQIKMIRNHPSLAFWCGGNEITPPKDILLAIKDTLLPQLDGTHWFIEYSNYDSMSYNTLGGNGDGPYGIQPLEVFWNHRTFPFNSEIGSVGTGDYESLKRFIPQDHLVPPGQYNDTTQTGPFSRYAHIDPLWRYHKYIGYGNFIDAYGKPVDVKDFGIKAQLVNYDQYRGLIEGFSAHMWEWYTGVIIWKTQNPWTALRGQMYDYYLDPNACLYGLHQGSEPLHIMCDITDYDVYIVNNTFIGHDNLMMQVKAYDMKGTSTMLSQIFCYVLPTSAKKYITLGSRIKRMQANDGLFLSCKLLDTDQKIVSENLYWLPDSTGNYSGLQQMPEAKIRAKASETSPGKIDVNIENAQDNPLAFFIRISLIDPKNHERFLPAFYSDNYISVEPGAHKTVTVEYTPENGQPTNLLIGIEGWNVENQYLPIE